MTAEPRNLMQGWCSEGIPLSEASAAIPLDAHEEREKHLATAAADDLRAEEARAATYLHVFTGQQPRHEDTNGRQRAVDLTLHVAEELAGIVEVTATIDSKFKHGSIQLQELVGQIDRRYSGTGHWALGFEHGWTMPGSRNLVELSQQLSQELERADARSSGEAEEPVPIGDRVVAYRVAEQPTSGVQLSSWSANIPASGDLPYLDRLTSYIATSDLIKKKLDKLRKEKERLESTRQHLYLLMAAAGESGGLLPASPSYFTWGNFACPEPVTDLWLDGATGEIYHWTRADGWTFHRLDN